MTKKWNRASVLLPIVISVLSGCGMFGRADHESVNGSNSIQAVKPTRLMALSSGTDYDTLGRGYVAYRKQCGQCHVYRLPKVLSKDKIAWHKTNWNVGMEKEDEIALLKYLSAEIKTRPTRSKGN